MRRGRASKSQPNIKSISGKDSGQSGGMASSGEESLGREEIAQTNRAEALESAEGSMHASVKPSSSTDDLENLRHRWYQKLLEIMPRHRPCAMPRAVGQGFPYYAVGHDPAVSSLAGVVVPDTDDMQANPHKTANLDPVVHLHTSEESECAAHDRRLLLKELTEAERKELNFFYGGCGDCRHVYMTLYDLGRQMEQGGEEVRTGNRVHFLLNDSSPAIFARNLLLLDALIDLSSCPVDAIRARQEPFVVQVLTFLYYVFLSPVVPSHVEGHLQLRIGRLLRDHSIFRSLYISDEDWMSVERVFRAWLAILNKEPGWPSLKDEGERFFQRYRSPNARENSKLTDQTVEWMRDYIDEMGLAAGFDNGQLRIRDRLVQERGRQVADIRESVFVEMDLEADLLYMIVHNVLPPPNQDLELHSEKVQCYRALSLNEDDVREAKQLLIKGVACHITRLVQEGYNETALMLDYTGNVTFLDPAIGNPQNGGGASQVKYSWQRASDFNTLEFLARLYIADGIETPQHGESLTLFDLSCNLWEKAAFAVKTLREGGDSTICFELSFGDMNLVAREVVLKERERQERGFPTRFLRAFTSNVPDYTGLIYPMVDIVPLLLPSTKAFLRLNALFNIHFWKTAENFAKYQLVFYDAKTSKKCVWCASTARFAPSKLHLFRKRSRLRGKPGALIPG